MKSNVLIVGAGPIGLLLAILLKKYDVEVVLIDKINSRLSHFSKALSVSSTSLKVFHGLGLIEEFLQIGKKLTRAEVFFNNRREFFIDKRYLKSPYNFYLSIPQGDTESILERELNNNSIFVRYQSEIVNIKQLNDKVLVKINNLKNEEITDEVFDFVIGCDGAHSTVRKLLNIGFTGGDYDTHFLLGDVCFEPEFYPSCPVYYVKKEGFIVLYPMNNKMTRIVIQVHGELPSSSNKPTMKDLQYWLDLYIPEKRFIKKLTWSSSAQIINRLANSMQVGHVFLSGDSCHLFSPVGGQAMNTGFQDAIDLAWKLGHYLNRSAKKTLLTTYATDRMIAIKKVLSLTDFYTRLIIGSPLSNNNNLRYHSPSFSSRSYYKEELPNQFGGYKADYSIEETSIVGRHVPYVKFNQQYRGFLSTYDLPCLTKHVLFYAEKTIDSDDLKKLLGYSDVLFLFPASDNEAGLIEQFNLKNKKICLISPAGFIILHGEVSDILKYLNMFYRSSCQKIINWRV